MHKLLDYQIKKFLKDAEPFSEEYREFLEVIENPSERDSLAAEIVDDLEPALKEFRSLMEQGHTEAQVNLGIMYSQGLGVPTWKRRPGNFPRNPLF